MGDFEGQRWRPYLDEEARERRDEILDHLQDNYDGPSDFVKRKLMEEAALDIEERIKRAESKEQEAKEKRKRLERIKREREEQSQLRDKKELLQEKQKKLRKLRDRDSKTEEEIREEVRERCEEKVRSSSQIDSVDELNIGVDERVRRRLEKQPDFDELVEDVQRLQDEIQELNGGDELDCFMDLRAESGVVG
jgi:DNA anti-recombination protein RmuC